MDFSRDQSPASNCLWVKMIFFLVDCSITFLGLVHFLSLNCAIEARIEEQVVHFKTMLELDISNLFVNDTLQVKYPAIKLASNLGGNVCGKVSGYCKKENISFLGAPYKIGPVFFSRIFRQLQANTC